MRAAAWVLIGIGMAGQAPPLMDSSATKRVVAHRGASAYAPEHTRAAYALAIAQGADYVEQDLGVTRDGVLVCLHDDSLERTTDVEERFPDRFTVDPSGRRRWMLADFTLAEVKTLEAGGWFDPRFAGEQVLTFDEAIAIVGARAGLYPELKSPALYTARGHDMARLVADALRRAGLAGSSAAGKVRPPVILQSFDPEALRRVATLLPDVPRVLLLDQKAAAEWLTAERLPTIREFAHGIGPAKAVIQANPGIVAAAHAAGLTVTPYPFRSAGAADEDVGAEMRRFLYAFGVDAVFTDNPDRFPRR